MNTTALPKNLKADSSNFMEGKFRALESLQGKGLLLWHVI